jgi:hypothetical protein
MTLEKQCGWCFALAVTVCLVAGSAEAESKQEYQNRVRVMFDYAVRMNDYVRNHLGDRKLSAYAQTMAEQNATQAERMTPPENYRMVHPHFLLVLENVERSFHYASKGDMAKYRQHQKTVRKELDLVEALGEKAGLELYLWGRRY